MKKIVSALIESAKTIGLNDVDINNSTELLDNREYGLAFDTVITQLYEYEIEIDGEFYEFVVELADKMKISKDKYSFMNELVREGNVIPKPVKDKLARILTTLESND